MEAYLSLRQAAISQQLALLREACLVLDRRDGWNIYYRLADTTIFALLDKAAALTGTINPEPVGQSVNCCCPHCASKSKTKSN
jgi:DNA-binding transcriptional ArsR family regulator